ncbi:hypothetical protein [Alkalimarinus alittae]|uniref:Uncharacterized protein n=1 Tax=Alkalimarinus alittae TaxID=2961619 RepID=A0ABY6N543_9ALTE|nr:hypothetical protein [Alkalimarinus alittae]UZE97238.1 hypothetical protein NKI27_05675 [Alkalimarinus alittae]
MAIVCRSEGQLWLTAVRAPMSSGAARARVIASNDEGISLAVLIQWQAGGT